MRVTQNLDGDESGVNKRKNIGEDWAQQRRPASVARFRESRTKNARDAAMP
jgi:hypothetical protein